MTPQNGLDQLKAHSSRGVATGCLDQIQQFDNDKDKQNIFECVNVIDRGQATNRATSKKVRRIPQQSHLRLLIDSLQKSQNSAQVGEIFLQFLETLNCSAWAMFQISASGSTEGMTREAAYGAAGLWQTPLHPDQHAIWFLTRILRLCPSPMSLSEISQRPSLGTRLEPLGRWLQRNQIEDVFLVPLIASDNNRRVLAIAGATVPNQRALRHQITLAATMVAEQYVQVRPVPPSPWPIPDPRLTPRQLEVAKWVVAGKSDWEIGTILRISPKTVNYHVENIKRSYGVRSRSQFIAAIVRTGQLNA